MQLNNYLNKRVHIILNNNFTFIGLVIDTDENSLTLIDKNNSHVSLKEEQIATIKELNNGS